MESVIQAVIMGCKESKSLRWFGEGSMCKDSPDYVLRACHFPAGLDQSGFAKELTYGAKIPISVLMPLPLSQATPCQLPVSKWCQLFRLPYFLLSLHWCVCVWAVEAALPGLLGSGFSWQPAARYCQVQSSCRREKEAGPGTEIKGVRD